MCNDWDTGNQHSTECLKWSVYMEQFFLCMREDIVVFTSRIFWEDKYKNAQFNKSLMITNALQYENTVQNFPFHVHGFSLPQDTCLICWWKFKLNVRNKWHGIKSTFNFSQFFLFKRGVNIFLTIKIVQVYERLSWTDVMMSRSQNARCVWNQRADSFDIPGTGLALKLSESERLC